MDATASEAHRKDPLGATIRTAKPKLEKVPGNFLVLNFFENLKSTKFFEVKGLDAVRSDRGLARQVAKLAGVQTLRLTMQH